MKYIQICSFILLLFILNLYSANNTTEYKNFTLFLFVPNFIDETLSSSIESPQKIETSQIKKKIVRSKKKPIITPTKISKKKKILSQEEILFKSGVKLIKLKSYKEAENTFIQLLQQYPDSMFKDKITYYLGEIMRLTKRYDEAILYYNKINNDFKQSSLRDRALYKLGYLYFLKKDYSSAKNILVQFEYLFPDSKLKDDALLLIGKIYEKEDKIEEAIQLYETIIKKYRKADRVDDALFRLGNIYEKKPNVRNFELAEKYYKKLIKNYPDSEYYISAKERIDFIKKNFLNYK